MIEIRCNKHRSAVLATLAEVPAIGPVRVPPCPRCAAYSTAEHLRRNQHAAAQGKPTGPWQATVAHLVDIDELRREIAEIEAARRRPRDTTVVYL